MIKTDMLLEAVEDLGIEAPHFYRSRSGDVFAQWRGEGDAVIALNALIGWTRRWGMAGRDLPLSGNVIIEQDHDADGTTLVLSLRVEAMPQKRRTE